RERRALQYLQSTPYLYYDPGHQTNAKRTHNPEARRTSAQAAVRQATAWRHRPSRQDWRRVDGRVHRRVLQRQALHGLLETTQAVRVPPRRSLGGRGSQLAEGAAGHATWRAP